MKEGRKEGRKDTPCSSNFKAEVWSDSAAHFFPALKLILAMPTFWFESVNASRLHLVHICDEKFVRLNVGLNLTKSSGPDPQRSVDQGISTCNYKDTHVILDANEVSTSDRTERRKPREGLP